MTTIRETLDTTHPDIPGYGVDAAPEKRPGVPHERRPEPVPGAHAIEPQRSVIGLTGTPVKGLRLTPVYGTAQPPRGLSGVIRRVAYRYPSHTNAHWLLLLGADRVDTLEHGKGRGLLAVGAVLAVAGLSASRLLRR